MSRALANCVVCLAIGALLNSTRPAVAQEPVRPETSEDLRPRWAPIELDSLEPESTQEVAPLPMPSAEEALPDSDVVEEPVETTTDAPAREENAWMRGSLSAGLLSAPESGDLGFGATLGAAALLGDELSLGGTLMVGIVPSDDDRANRIFGGLNIGPTFSQSLGDFRFSLSLEAGLFGGTTQATKLQVGFFGSVGLEVAAEVGQGLALTLGARSIVLYADSPHGLALITLGLSYDET